MVKPYHDSNHVATSAGEHAAPAAGCSIAQRRHRLGWMGGPLGRCPGYVSLPRLSTLASSHHVYVSRNTEYLSTMIVMYPDIV